MPVAAPLALAGATIGSAVIGSSAAKKAAKAQTASAQAGIDEQRRQYDTTRADLAPWREAGGQAIQAGSAMLQPGYDYKSSPGYDWRFNEGQRAVQGSAAAGGHLLSGGTLKDLLSYGEGLAAQDFGDSFNRQMAIASGGQQAATSTGQFGQQAAGNIGNLLTQQGNARASGYMGSANAWGQGLGNLASLFSGAGGGGGAFPAFNAPISTPNYYGGNLGAIY